MGGQHHEIVGMTQKKDLWFLPNFVKMAFIPFHRLLRQNVNHVNVFALTRVLNFLFAIKNNHQKLFETFLHFVDNPGKYLFFSKKLFNRKLLFSLRDLNF